MICCDGKLDTREKQFLASAAKQMGFDITPFNGWSQLIKQVHKDQIGIYPIKDKQKAISTLKGLIVMAKVDRHLDKREKTFIQNFAKSLGIGNVEFSDILKDIDKENLFESFTNSPINVGSMVVLEDEFEKFNDLAIVASENGVTVKTTTTQAFVASELPPEHVVCFHASENKENSTKRCQVLLQKTGADLICILTRFQGHQVKYLHELGLNKCIIEPVYSRDVMDMFKK